jgi:hypothetical protein
MIFANPPVHGVRSRINQVLDWGMDELEVGR